MKTVMPSFNLPSLDIPTIAPVRSPAEQAFSSLVEQIQQFEKTTNEDEVVAAMLASFGHSVTIHIHQIRRAGQFFGMDGVTSNGEEATLLQHFTQASLLLIKAPKAPAEEKRPIGFIS